MKIIGLTKKAILLTAVLSIPVGASEELGFAGLAEPTPPPPVEKFTGLKEISIGYDSSKKVPIYLIAKLKQLTKEQKILF